MLIVRYSRVQDLLVSVRVATIIPVLRGVSRLSFLLASKLLDEAAVFPRFGCKIKMFSDVSTILRPHWAPLIFCLIIIIIIIRIIRGVLKPSQDLCIRRACLLPQHSSPWRRIHDVRAAAGRGREISTW